MTSPILDGNLTDWTSADRLESAATTIAGYQLYGRYSDGIFYFALQSALAIGANTTLWLNTDKSLDTGYKVWGFAAGAEFNVNFGADGIPHLYTGADGQTLVGNLTYALSADHKTLEIALPKTLLGAAVTSVDVLADINNSVFLPGDYTQPAYRIADLTTIPAGPYDGLLTEWTQAQRLDTDANAVAGYEVYGKVSNDSFVFGVKSAISIGANTTFWLNTDNNTATGYQIWGWAGGAEYNVNIGTDGVARLYSGADGQTLVGNINYAIAPDQHSIEFEVPRSLIGGAAVTSINLLADINNSVYLPPSYGAGSGYSLVDPAVLPPTSFDGLLTDWTQAQRLDGTDNAQAGYEVYGKATADSFVFALKSAVAIGSNSTFWLNTDGNTATGYQIWGFAGGAEFNVNIGTDGVARLYTGGAGQTLVGTIDYALSPDKHSIEFGVLKSVLGASVTSVTMVADINDSVYLPVSYGTMAGFSVVDTAGHVSAFDGLLTEWTAAQRLDGTANGVDGYEIYGKTDATSFIFAMKSAAAIGPNTTFWLNTDDNATTGYQIWGFAGGAEFNVNIGADGVARLYSGGAGETLIGTVDYAISPDKHSIEFGVLKSQLGPTVTSITMVADVNDQVFLPTSYGTMAGFKLVDTANAPHSAFDGLLNEWTQSQRLETPVNATDGYELYGKYADGSFIFGLKSAVTIGPNTTFWFNTDGNTTTGTQVFGSGIGAEYNINIGADGVARLYTGTAGQTLVSTIDYAIAPDGKSMEFALPASLIGGVHKVGVVADVNDSAYLPGDYTKPEFVLQDPALLPPPTYTGHKIAIVYSDSTEANYFNPMAYSQLVMAAQSQAMAAGIPYDLIGESQLTNIATLANYDAIVFPSFRNVPANYQQIADTLTEYVYGYHKSIITAGDFMTNDAAGNALPGDSYARMESLLGLHRTGGESGVAVDVIANGTNEVTSGYGANGLIHSYTGAATSYFAAVNPGLTAVTTFATEVVGGVSHDAVIGTVTGARNVTFSTDALLADDNLLGKAIDWVMNPTSGVEISLHMTRNTEIVASRTDLDQSQETADVDGPDGTTNQGIYDKLLPILQTWKAQYNFVGSYYANIGLNAPDQTTDWLISKPYYDALMAMGNEIGSHSYTHPENTNYLLPTTVTQATLDAATGQTATGGATSESPAGASSLYGYTMTLQHYNAVLAEALAAANPMTLDKEHKDVLMATFQFQFGNAGTTLAAALGLTSNPDVAVPGMPESLETARNIMQYVTDYLSGGASMVGAGYPGAIGFLSPTDQQAVYIAPNMAFDFTLTDWLKLNPEASTAEWAKELAQLTTNSDMPIIVWPWHDYGPTQWSLDEGVPSNDTLAMFTSVIAAAYSAGAEFVTLDDLAHRIKAFDQTSFGYSISGDVITVNVAPATGGLGTFAVDFGSLGGKEIASVANWYAYDTDSVFLDNDGGTFSVTLGTAIADVTHITSIDQRAQLMSLTGDGNSLAFTIAGEGKVVVDVHTVAGMEYAVTGATVVSQVGDIMTLDLGGIGSHQVVVQQKSSNHLPTGSVAVAGAAVVNQVLTANTATLADLDGLGTLSYQWQRSVGGGAFTAIAAAVGATYALSSADAASSLRVVVSYTDGLGHPESVTSTATAGVALAPVVIAASVEDMLRYVNADELAGTSVGLHTISNLAVSSGTLGVNPDGTWSFIPVLNDDTGVTFTYKLTTAAGTFDASATLDLTPMTDVNGTAAADNLLGKTTADQYHGGAGNDTIAGGAGNDIFFGDAGNDKITGDAGNDRFVATIGDGNDTYTGGADIDTYDLSRTNAAATVDLSTGRASSADTGTDTLATIENVIGSAGNDTITGNTGANQLEGGFGNDTLNGGAGNDILLGGWGDDKLNGGTGVDRLTGGAGNDTFIFSTLTDSGKTATTRDIIMDFTQGQDHIDLSPIDANNSLAGNQAFTFLATPGAAFTGVRGQLQFSFSDVAGTDNDATIIQGDTNGDKVADFQIEVHGLITLTAADFIL